MHDCNHKCAVSKVPLVWSSGALVITIMHLAAHFLLKCAARCVLALVDVFTIRILLSDLSSLSRYPVHALAQQGVE